MWNTFAKIFDNHKGKLHKKDPYLLTSISPKKPTPAKSKVTLWPHQQAMLAKCQEIETTPRYATPTVRYTERYKDQTKIPQYGKCAIGVMNDPPGSGKTYGILSLIAADEDPGTNIVIVPQHIYVQWENAIKTFFGDKEDKTMPYLCCNSYGIISQLYMRPKAFNKFNVILINDIFADNLAITLADNNIAIKRLIIDEVDAIQKRMFNPINAKHVWLLSASFVHNEYLTIGPYMINTEDMEHIICKCDIDFVAEHLAIFEPSGEAIECNDNDIMLFKDIVPDSVFTALNAGDIHELLKSMANQYPPEKRQLHMLAEAKVKEFQERIEVLAKTTDELENSLLILDEDDPGDSFDFKRMKMELVKIGGELAQVKESKVILEKRLETYVAPGDKSKAAIFTNDICNRIKTTPASKWLIFNDNHSALFQAQKELLSLDISCALIDGGSPEAINNAIKSYKEGWVHEVVDGSGNKIMRTDHVQVLLLNSSTEGTGMNLENTTHMIFMHATKPQLIEQVVGRAQRFGRVGQLLIIGLFNKNENPIG
jgi:hypothetical protein